MILEDFFGQVVTFNLSSSYQNFDPTGDIPNTRDFFPKLNTKSRKQHKCATHKNTKVITNSINYVLKIKKANESGNCDSNTQKLFTEYSAKAVFKFCYFNVRNRCGIFSTKQLHHAKLFGKWKKFQYPRVKCCFLRVFLWWLSANRVRGNKWNWDKEEN